MAVTAKVCSKCLIEKPLESFSKNSYLIQRSDDLSP